MTSMKRAILPGIAALVVLSIMVGMYILITTLTSGDLTWILASFDIILGLFLSGILGFGAYLGLKSDKEHLKRAHKSGDDDEKAPAEKPQPAAKPEKVTTKATATTKTSGNNSFLKGSAALLGVLILFFAAPHIWHWANASFFHFQDPSAQVMVATNSQGMRTVTTIERCTEEPKEASVTKDEVTWVEIPHSCRLHAELASDRLNKLFELSCRDLGGTEHVWTREDCDDNQAVGFKLKQDARDDSYQLPLTFVNY